MDWLTWFKQYNALFPQKLLTHHSKSCTQKDLQPATVGMELSRIYIPGSWLTRRKVNIPAAERPLEAFKKIAHGGAKEYEEHLGSLSALNQAGSWTLWVQEKGTERSCDFMNGFQNTRIPTLKSGVLLKLSSLWVYQWSKVNGQCGIEWDLQLCDRSVSRQPRPCGFFPPTIWGSGAAPCPLHQANLSGNPEIHSGFKWWDCNV